VAPSAVELRKIMRILTLALCLDLLGCSDATMRTRDVSEAAREASMLVYFKDPRTGLCFAGRWFTSNAAQLASVPCSDAVERMIAEQASTSPDGP
jgi:hypothetical protein